MRKSRKEQNMQEMLDQVHNLNLKQKLNADLKREQAILNPIAVDLKRQEITDKYKEHLGQFKEQKLRRKAEDKAKIDLYKNQLNNSIEQKLIDEEKAKEAAKTLSIESTPTSKQIFIKQMQRGSKYGLTKYITPKSKPGPKGERSKSTAAKSRDSALRRQFPKTNPNPKSSKKSNTLM